MTEEIDLRDIVKIIWKRLWLIILFVIISSVLACVISYTYLTPVYEASTKLIVNKSTVPSDIPQQYTLSDINFNIRLIDTYREVIKTHAIMDQVAAENPDFELTGKELIEKVKVSSGSNSQVMTLVVQDPSYKKAANIVNAISSVFQRKIPTILNVDNISILNTADLAEQPAPIKPNPKLNIAIAFVVSAMLAVGVVFLLEYIDDTIKSEKEVEQLLGLPTLAMITKIKPEDIQEKRKKPQTQQVGESIHGAVEQ